MRCQLRRDLRNLPNFSIQHWSCMKYEKYIPSVILLAACAVGLLVKTSNRSREPQSWNLSLDISLETTLFFLAEM